MSLVRTRLAWKCTSLAWPWRHRRQLQSQQKSAKRPPQSPGTWNAAKRSKVQQPEGVQLSPCGDKAGHLCTWTGRNKVSCNSRCNSKTMHCHERRSFQKYPRGIQDLTGFGRSQQESTESQQLGAGCWQGCQKLPGGCRRRPQQLTRTEQLLTTRSRTPIPEILYRWD